MLTFLALKKTCTNCSGGSSNTLEPVVQVNYQKFRLLFYWDTLVVMIEMLVLIDNVAHSFFSHDPFTHCDEAYIEGLSKYQM